MIKTFLKGIAMGICDLVPGISGGTVALLLGIYKRFIDALTNLNLAWVKPLWNYLGEEKKKDLNQVKKHFKRMDAAFLVTVALGMLTAILVGARGIRYLVYTYPSFILSFFFGLILAAAILLTKDVSLKKDKLFWVLGLVIGIVFSVLVPIEPEHNFWLTLLSGFLAITAMLLPGISGSYVLLLIGQYDFILESIELFSWVPIFVFSAGGILALLTMSRFIDFLLERYKHKTMTFLIGLVFGSLGVIIKQLSSSFPAVGLIVVGFAIPFLIHQFAKK